MQYKLNPMIINTEAIKNFIRKPYGYLSIVAVGALTLYFTVGKSFATRSDKINPAFANYIAAYTSGTISKVSSIRIQLAGNFGDSSKVGAETNVFSFDPDIRGKAVWVDASTIEFKPEQPMVSGTQYEAVFHLDKIITVSDELEEFPFQFSIIEQSFEVQFPIFEAIDKQTLIDQRVSGTLLTADVEAPEKVEQLLSVNQEGKAFRVKWEHAADNRTHRYIIDSVLRKAKPSEVKIGWDGAPIGVELVGEHKLIIPALGDFRVMQMTVQNDGEQYVSIYFSDPISTSQDLTGLISFAPNPNSATQSGIDLRFSVNGNEVKCYPGIRMLGQHVLTVSAGIKNILGFPMPEGMQQELDFADMLPAVNFIGKGVIMPSSNELMLPFEAVGLSAVDITVVKIYESNIAQFLQVNDLTGSREMVRVGRPVLKKTMRLDNDRLVDLRKPNRFAISLDKLIRTEPGAVYNVKISFKKAYSLYRCEAGTQTAAVSDEDMQSTDDGNWDEGVDENNYWYYDEYDDDYSWSERDNPCHASYYNPQRWVTKNIMASNLGIITKRGTNEELLVAVTDLKTTEPLSGVNVDLLDYQQKIIVSGKTDGEGILHITPPRKPFLLVASFNGQKGYLKLDDGSSLSLSHFDVSGDVVQKGLKGFIYGERGVWRPGDSIYLTFVLEDRNNILPAAHPVSLDLFDPNGVLQKRLVQNKSVNGFYKFFTSTDAEAPTGTWLAKIKVGGVTFQKNLRIETVMPNRLKIDLAFKKAYLQKADKLNGVLTSKWLHGAIADGLNAKVDVTLTPTATTFKRFADYTFDDPSRRFNAEPQTVFDGKLDGNGQAMIESEIVAENRASGMLNANFTTKVFEAGGNFSIDRFSIPFHPYKVYVGIKTPQGDEANGMIVTDTNHTIQIVGVQPNGMMASGNRKVIVKVYKIQWRWWWDRSEEDMSSFSENEEYQPIQEAVVTLVNGKGQWKLRINYPEWGRYLVRVTDEEGHSTGKTVYMDWPGWVGRAQRENAVEATMLTFNADKSSYKVGDDAILMIPSSKGGRALVSIESGSRVVETHWVETQQTQTRYTFKVTRNMLPNVFIHITLVQPHAQTQNDLPIRLYGMLPIKVEDETTILKPVIGMENQLKPDERSTIAISEATGKPMTYTLAIVDEGLLDLTRFKTPDLHAQFYAREALGVKTWDMYDYVMGAFGMQMNRILSVGGDEGINKKAGNKKANRFKPVVKFIGPFHLDGGKTASHQITIENYVGSVRVMVVAGENGAYGLAEKAVPVKKPLMVLATLPRVLGPGERVKLPVTVFAMENRIKQVQVQVKGNGLVEFEGGETKTIHFTKPGDEVIDFDMKVKQFLGIGKVKVIVSSGAEKAEYDVELDVRNPNPYLTNITDGTIDAGKFWQTKYAPIGISGTNSAVLEVSSIPALNLEKRLRYLVTYPHGCVEQTTSAAFPQLALNNLMQLSDGWKREIERNVKGAIQKLKTFQTAEGGMSYWPGEQRTDDWSTSYAGHFMIEAQNAGYSLPISFMSNWKRYQRNKALVWTSSESASNDMIQAYRLYTLALANASELGAMNRLKELKTLSLNARWRLAAAYVLVGQKSVALQLIQNQPLTSNTPAYWGYTYGSSVRDEAMILETLILLEDKSRASKVMLSLAKQVGSDQWMSTQTTAYALMSIAKLTGKFNDQKVLEFDYTINGVKSSYRSSARMAQLPVKMDGRAGSVMVTNQSGQLLFTRLIVKGQPAVGDRTTSQSNLQMEIVYKDMDGKELNPLSIEQGTDFKAEVSITHPGILGNYDQMALSQIFPSGWEIHNTRMNEVEGQPSNYSIPRYQDIRDDRVYTYFTLPARQKATYVVLLNASYVGRYYLPSISCEEMYNGDINARTAGVWVEVVPRKSAAQRLAVQ